LVKEAWSSGNKPLSLSAIEEIGLGVRAKIGEEVIQTWVDQQGRVEVPGPKPGNALQGIEKTEDNDPQRRSGAEMII